MTYVGKSPADIIATAVDTTTGTFSGDLTVDTNTLYVDSANNRVGIRTSSPSDILHIKDSSSTNVIIDAPTDNASLTLQCGSSDAGAEGAFINFIQNTTSKWQMGMNTDNTFRWYNYNTSSEAMQIDSSGNFLVGTTNSIPGAGNTAVGASIYNDGRIFLSKSANTVASFNRNTSDGAIAEFRKDGSTVGSIGAEGGQTYIVTGDTGLKFAPSVDAIIPVNAGGANRDNAIDLGVSSVRFKDLYLSGGAYIGGTGSANYLDDYEEGTWTASLYGTSSGTGTNITHTAHYSKVGNIVTVGGYFQDMNLSSMSGSVNISGLPFTATGNNYTGSIILYGFTFSGYVTPYVGPGGTTIDILDSVSGSAWAGVAIPAAAGKYVMFSLTYRAS